MHLSVLRVRNYRSLTDTGDVHIRQLQALVGANSAGKSNLLRAVQAFLAPGAGGIGLQCFRDKEKEITIECEFAGLSRAEQKRLRPYLVNGRIKLLKEFRIEHDERRDKATIKTVYHGYRAEPRNPLLSLVKIGETYSARPPWKEIAEQAGILEWVRDPKGGVTAQSFRAGLERYLEENDVPYDEPDLSQTQALGIPQNLLSVLPDFYLLPAVTDYTAETDRRSSSTIFRRLVGALFERVVRSDPYYGVLEQRLADLGSMLNTHSISSASDRLGSLAEIEKRIAGLTQKLMPTVRSVAIGVEIESVRDLFSRGIRVMIDDGVLTDVMDKGHGLQRSMVFALLQLLISVSRAADDDSNSIIIGIEEPELYIHPHLQRVIYRVMRDLTSSDDKQGYQIIYSTHSPVMVDVRTLDSIAVVRKNEKSQGTVVYQARPDVIGDLDEEKKFKLLTSFGVRHNEMFFARYVLIVEGAQDEVVFTAAARKAGLIKELFDEKGISVVVAGAKGNIPKFQRICNAFRVPYAVVLECDGEPLDSVKNKAITALLAENKMLLIEERLECLLGLEAHFTGSFHAMRVCGEAENITEAVERLIRDMWKDFAERCEMETDLVLGS